MIGEIIEMVLIWAICIAILYFDCKFDPDHKKMYIVWIAVTVILYTISNVIEIISMLN